MVQYLLDHAPDSMTRQEGIGKVLEAASYSGHYELVECMLTILEAATKTTTDPALVSALRTTMYHLGKDCQLGLLKRVHKLMPVPISRDAAYQAAEKGCLPILQFLADKLDEPLGEDEMYAATAYGQWEVIEWLRQQGVPLVDDVKPAVVSGDLELVKWLAGQGAVVDQEAIETAAEHGHLEVLKYLESLGLTLDNQVLINAVESGNYELVQYLLTKHQVTRGADDLLEVAIRDGDLDVLGLLWPVLAPKLNKVQRVGLLEMAIQQNDLHAVEFLTTQGVRDDNEAMTTAFQFGRVDIVAYLVELGAAITDEQVSVAIEYREWDLVWYVNRLVAAGRRFNLSQEVIEQAQAMFSPDHADHADHADHDQASD